MLTLSRETSARRRLTEAHGLMPARCSSSSTRRARTEGYPWGRAALASRRLELETRSREAKVVAAKYRVPQAEKAAEAHLIQKYGVGKPLRSGSAFADWGQDRDQNGTVVARVRKVKLTYLIAGTKACASVDTAVVEPFDGKRYDANGTRVEVDMWAQLEPCQK